MFMLKITEAKNGYIIEIIGEPNSMQIATSITDTCRIISDILEEREKNLFNSY